MPLDMPPDPPAILARLVPSGPRRVLASLALGGVGALVVQAALAQGTVGAQGVLAVLGIVFLVTAFVLFRATGGALVLTEAGLADEAGRLIAARADMVRVERSAFTLRPSNGFVVVLARPMPLAWAPGLWWRVGRYLGVGGITSRAATRLMGETVAQWLDDSSDSGR